MRKFVFLLLLHWLCQYTNLILASNSHNVHSFERSSVKQESMVSSNLNENYRQKRDSSTCAIIPGYENTLKSSRNEVCYKFVFLTFY